MAEYHTLYITKSIPRAITHAKRLELDSEFSGLWIGDTHQLWTDPYVTLSACAMTTDELNLGVGVTNPVTRHPTVTANAISSIGQLTDANVRVGIGAGDSAVFSIGETPVAVDRLRETVEQLHSLFASDPVTYGDTEFELAVADPDAAVYVAASGPRTLEMAGSVADRIIVGSGGDASVIEEYVRTHVERGARRAGRDLSELTLCMLLTAYTATTTAAAAEKVRSIVEPQAAIMYRHYREHIPEAFREPVGELVDRHEMSEHAEADADAAVGLSDELAEFLAGRHAVAGTPDDCRERLDRLEAAGIDEFMLIFPPDVAEEAAIEFSHEVLECA